MKTKLIIILLFLTTVVNAQNSYYYESDISRIPSGVYISHESTGLTDMVLLFSYRDTNSASCEADTFIVRNLLKLSGGPTQYVKGDGSFAAFPSIPTNTNQLTNGAGFISSEVDGSVSNEIQTLSINTNTVSISSGNSIVLPANPGTNTVTAYSSGTIYTLSTTSAKVDFGTTDPSITISTPGTYMIFTNLKIEYSGLTTLLNTCNFKLRRTNNTAADIPSAITNFGVVATLLTGTGGDVDIAPVIYTTTNNNDVIELWGNRQTGISITGNINVGEASIVAVRIY
jgi:hypothetical protein